MSINCTNSDKLEEFIINNLSEKRYKHSLGVEKMASHLAKIYGEDVEKAKLAGRYHDIAKCFDQSRMDELVKKYNLPSELIGHKSLAHSKVGAELLKNEFGIQDSAVLDAIRSHTTGRPDMSLLEEIIYVSDAIEENRDYPELENLQKLAERDIDATCLIIMDYALDMLHQKGKEADVSSLKAREWINNKINNKQENSIHGQ